MFTTKIGGNRMEVDIQKQLEVRMGGKHWGVCSNIM